MARYYKVLILSSLLSLVSCQEGSEAGDLLGQWKMTSADNKYISFSGSLAMFRSIYEGEIIGNVKHIGDSLFIHCYSQEGTPTDTAIIENSFGFKPFTDIRLKIDVLDGDRLVLSQKNQTWNFEKY